MHPFKRSQLLEAVRADDTLALCLNEQIGIAVRSLIAFRRGDVLDRFDGRITRKISQHSLQLAPGWHISQTRFVGYLPHGCDPNSALDMPQRQLVALRDIAPGELIRIDYAATEDRLYADFACSCGAADCRGWITGRLGSSTA